MHTLRSFIALYNPVYVLLLVRAFKARNYQVSAFENWLWHTNIFAVPATKSVLSSHDKILAALLCAVGLGELAVGAGLITSGIHEDLTGGISFGLAVILATPIVLGSLVPLLHVLAQLLVGLHPKSLGKAALCLILEWQVGRLRKVHSIRIVAVAGSMGKTSTKLATAQILESCGMRVRYQQGNYNDRLTVPLVLFGQPLPGLYNAYAWLGVIRANEQVIKGSYPYDIAILELGTDRPGEIGQFSYLKPDIAVITGIAPEHMENFGSLDAVAEEELLLADYAKKTLLNVDDTAGIYSKKVKHISYGLLQAENGYYAEGAQENLYGQHVTCMLNGEQFAEAHIQFLGAQGRKIVLAAAAVADMLGVPHSKIAKALAELQPFSGRMQILPGVKDSTLIDDTYNATPAAVEAALQVLMSADASQRIAVLGSMNELGDFEIEAHKAIGASLNPQKISLVVTVGKVAEAYLAPVAMENGCEVHSFLNPRAAGEFVKSRLKNNAVILFKGSQNGVFTEEALKPLLAEQADAEKLVRQSRYWMKRKQAVLKSK